MAGVNVVETDRRLPFSLGDSAPRKTAWGGGGRGIEEVINP